MNLVVPMVKCNHIGECSFSYDAPPTNPSREWNKTCFYNFGLLWSHILIIVSYCILYRFIYIYDSVILLIIYALSYTCIFVTVADHLHTLHLYLQYWIRYLCLV